MRLLCPASHHGPAQRGSELSPALAVPGGTCHPPVLQHWVLHRLPGVAWTLLDASSITEQLQVSCRGGKSSELSHPSQHWVLTLEPRYENEKLMALRGLAGWALPPCLPRWVPGQGEDLQGVLGLEPHAAPSAALPCSLE